jgi:hypothetical protein
MTLTACLTYHARAHSVNAATAYAPVGGQSTNSSQVYTVSDGSPGSPLLPRLAPLTGHAQKKYRPTLTAGPTRPTWLLMYVHIRHLGSCCRCPLLTFGHHHAPHPLTQAAPRLHHSQHPPHVSPAAQPYAPAAALKVDGCHSGSGLPLALLPRHDVPLIVPPHHHHCFHHL